MNDTYQVHADLLAQTASSAEEESEVRRVLSACLCNGCEQGRKQCPTPDACEVQEREDSLGAASAVVLMLPLGIIAWIGIISAVVAYRAELSFAVEVALAAVGVRL